ncbi:MAG TPA: class I SAM-dependent methyltransferase [Chitinophagaceae bacterium]|nr:class I SAM-dependent methyltransferase [Chitinophagaceae bacterium]
MYSKFQLVSKYLGYRLNASNGRGHGMHSPFVYSMIREIFMDRNYYPAYERPELYKKKLLDDETLLDVQDFGAGSSSVKTRERRVSEIARTSSKHQRYSRLIYRIASYYQCKYILEMGTSLGVTSSYLAQVPGLEKLVTMEGADAIADIAARELEAYQTVHLVRGEFQGRVDASVIPDKEGSRRQTVGSRDDIDAGYKTNLVHALDLLPQLDLAFIDGNHRLVPTLQYFETIMTKTHEGSIIIFDDIHWSSEMETAWEKIRNDERVKLSIDLFFIGLVFFRKAFKEKQHFTISF